MFLILAIILLHFLHLLVLVGVLVPILFLKNMSMEHGVLCYRLLLNVVLFLLIIFIVVFFLIRPVLIPTFILCQVILIVFSFLLLLLIIFLAVHLFLDTVFAVV